MLRLIIIRCFAWGVLFLQLTGCQPEPVVAIGTLEADRIELVAPEAEVITDIAVQAGDGVSQGQRLIQLDATSATADLGALTAHRDQAAARVAELERGPRQELIAQARAVVEGSRSQLTQARHNLDRQLSLQQKDLTSEELLESARTHYDAAVAKLKADQENLNALESGTTAEELQQARQALLQAEAQIIPARVRLQRLSVSAPADGVIDDVLFDVGEQPGQQAVVAVMFTNARRYARVYLPQPYRAAVVVGSQLSVRFAGQEDTVTGVVTRVSADPAFTPYYALTERDRSRLAYLAEIDLPVETVARFPVGMPVEVILHNLSP